MKVLSLSRSAVTRTKQKEEGIGNIKSGSLPFLSVTEHSVLHPNRTLCFEWTPASETQFNKAPFLELCVMVGSQRELKETQMSLLTGLTANPT